MKKNPIRMLSGIPSLISMFIILLCPLTNIPFLDYNVFSIADFTDKSETAGIIVAVTLVSAIFSLIAFITATLGVKNDSKDGAIFCNIVGLIPMIYIIYYLTNNNYEEYIGITIILCIILNIIAVIMLGVSDMFFNILLKNDSITNAEELKKYKELLDMGAITNDEYEAKKSILINNRNDSN